MNSSNVPTKSEEINTENIMRRVPEPPPKKTITNDISKEELHIKTTMKKPPPLPPKKESIASPTYPKKVPPPTPPKRSNFSSPKEEMKSNIPRESISEPPKQFTSFSITDDYFVEGDEELKRLIHKPVQPSKNINIYATIRRPTKKIPEIPHMRTLSVVNSKKLPPEKKKNSSSQIPKMENEKEKTEPINAKEYTTKNGINTKPESPIIEPNPSKPSLQRQLSLIPRTSNLKFEKFHQRNKSMPDMRKKPPLPSRANRKPFKRIPIKKPKPPLPPRIHRKEKIMLECAT